MNCCRYTLHFFVLFLIGTVCRGQPYHGVAAAFKNIIAQPDSTAFDTLTFKGISQQKVFDRRQGGVVIIDAYIFEITWLDEEKTEAIVNAEFGTFDAAESSAKLHARAVGQLPYCLRTHLNQIVIHSGYNRYGGGNNRLLLYHLKTLEHIQKGQLEEILVHEAAHTPGQKTGRSGEWKNVQKADGAFISQYAKNFPDREDFSESFLAWLLVTRYLTRIKPADAEIIKKTIPARLSFFNRQNYNTSLLKANAP